jgi:uncharacterized membrane protein
MSSTPKRGTYVRVRRAVTVARPLEDVYRFWRELDNLPSFARHLKSVKLTSERESRWVARGPMDQTFEWEAEITAEEPNRLLAWRTRPGAQIEHQAEVRFQVAPGDQGTVVVVVIDYYGPGVYSGFHDKMSFGAAFAKGLTIKTGQTHVQRYMSLLLKVIERGEIDPSFVITHRMPLEHAAKAYKLFARQQDHCLKVVLKPRMGIEEGELELVGQDRVSGGKRKGEPLPPRENEEQSRTE